MFIRMVYCMDLPQNRELMGGEMNCISNKINEKKRTYKKKPVWDVCSGHIDQLKRKQEADVICLAVNQEGQHCERS